MGVELGHVGQQMSKHSTGISLWESSDLLLM